MVTRTATIYDFREFEKAVMKRFGLKHRLLPLALALLLGERVAKQEVDLEKSEVEALKEYVRAWEL